MGGGFLAISLMPLGDATVIIFTAPLWSGIAGWVLLGERWALGDLCAALLGFGGGPVGSFI